LQPELAAARSQQRDDTLPVTEVVPKLLGIEEVQLFLLITEQLS
jgi:hypothetical protein